MMIKRNDNNNDDGDNEDNNDFGDDGIIFEKNYCQSQFSFKLRLKLELGCGNQE